MSLKLCVWFKEKYMIQKIKEAMHAYQEIDRGEDVIYKQNKKYVQNNFFIVLFLIEIYGQIVRAMKKLFYDRLL